MKKKLASVLYSMNYELATHSCADQLVESPALTLIVGVAKRAQLRAHASSMWLFTSNNTVSVVLWADSRRLKVTTVSIEIQRYVHVWLSHS